ncbi:hypothetical protein [Corynebacterium auriscanis]|uniref:hypothetical protein n=1 Tax=Corynebacterium auriscanis TaxID=99807 RepID=UPI003CF28534
MSDPAGDDWLATEDASVDSDPDSSAQTPGGGQPRLTPRAQTRLVLGAFGVIVVALGVSVAFVVDSFSPNDDQPSQAHEAALAQPASDTQDNEAEPTQAMRPESQQKFAGECSGKTPAVKPSQDSLNGAIAAFQEAYFDKDGKKITTLVSADSALKKQNWKKVLSSIDDTTTYCVTLQPGKSNNTVNADLTVTAKGKKTLYRQTVTGTQHKGSWVITSIDKRTDTGKAK